MWKLDAFWSAEISLTERATMQRHRAGFQIYVAEQSSYPLDSSFPNQLDGLYAAFGPSSSSLSWLNSPSERGEYEAF